MAMTGACQDCLDAHVGIPHNKGKGPGIPDPGQFLCYQKV